MSLGKPLPRTSLPKAALAKSAAPKHGPAANRGKSERSSGSLMTPGRWIALAIAILLLGTGAAWCTGLIGPDPRLAEIHDLQVRLADTSLSDQDRRAVWGEFRKKMQDLPEDLRSKARQSMMTTGQFPGAGRGPKIKEILAMSEKDRNAALDKQIDAQLEREKKRLEEAAKNAQQSSDKPGDANTKQAASGGSGQGGPRWGGPSPDGSKPGNRWLSSIPADSRATMGTFRQLMQARAMQRGIQLPQWGGPR